MRRALPALATTVALLAAPAPAAYAAPAVEADPVHALIIFDKSAKNPWHSTVVWKAYRGEELLERATWRAGSGFGGPHTRDACYRNRGWLPNGVYSFVQHDDYAGNLIKGRAFYLGNKRCHDGTLRTDLFIHTETGAGNQQCADRKGDQLCRWEWPKINDYRSAGCVKMSPRDLRQLTAHFHRWFDAGVRYPLRRVQVRVRS